MALTEPLEFKASRDIRAMARIKQISLPKHGWKEAASKALLGHALVTWIDLDTMTEGSNVRARFERVQIGMTVNEMRERGLSGLDLTTAIARERLTLSTGLPQGTLTRSDVQTLASLRSGMTVAEAIEGGVTKALLLRAINCGVIALEAGEIKPSGVGDETVHFFIEEIVEGLEGQQKVLLVRHRQREQRVRRKKLEEALRRNRGRLLCEVPNCGFDFAERYGPLGEGYAQVHHIEPISQAPEEGRIVTLDQLKVVCANCHAMIHLGGTCRSLEELIPRKGT